MVDEKLLPSRSKAQHSPTIAMSGKHIHKWYRSKLTSWRESGVLQVLAGISIVANVLLTIVLVSRSGGRGDAQRGCVSTCQHRPYPHWQVAGSTLPGPALETGPTEETGVARERGPPAPSFSSFKTWQDPRRKPFLGLIRRLQPHYVGPSTVAELSRSEPIFATFSNAAPVYVEQLLNWAFHLRELALPHLVVCLDLECEEIAASNGIPAVAVENRTTSEDVRNDHATFRDMVARKVDLARVLLETYHFSEVIWTDTDVVWLRSPLAFLAEHPSADLAIQTDCLSHSIEAGYSQPFQHHVSRCGHMPGNTFNNAFNTGMILFRNRPATFSFLRGWLGMLVDDSQKFVNLGGGARAVMGDQLAFNKLITQGAIPWRSVEGVGDWRVVWAMNATVKFMPLPTLMFSGGHSYFIQHLAERYNTTPFYAHACLVPGHVPGKVSRFREHNLWAIEDDAYYAEGNFLWYENTVRTFIQKLDDKAGVVRP